MNDSLSISLISLAGASAMFAFVKIKANQNKNAGDYFDNLTNKGVWLDQGNEELINILPIKIVISTSDKDRQRKIDLVNKAVDEIRGVIDFSYT